jgi:adenosylhomocysteine nucleosidase
MEDASAVGVVTGLRAEARCLRRLKVRVLCSGGSAERARAVVAALVVGRVAGLVSFGLAGGLAPDLRPGDLLLPDAVVTPEGSSIAVDPSWRARLGARFDRAGLRPDGRTLLGSESVVATVRDKQALLESSRACAVDMESHAVAGAACKAGIPFVIIRAVADAYDRVIPQAALEALRPDGRVRVPATLGGVIRQPGQLIALLRLGGASAVALATLRRAVALSGPDLGFDRRARNR